MSHIVSGGMKIRERVGVQIGERVRISRKPNRRDPYADPINPPNERKRETPTSREKAKDNDGIPSSQAPATTARSIELSQPSDRPREVRSLSSGVKGASALGTQAAPVDTA